MNDNPLELFDQIFSEMVTHGIVWKRTWFDPVSDRIKIEILDIELLDYEQQESEK